MIKINNYEYLQRIPIDLLHATLRGLIGTHEMKDPDKADIYLLNWLKSDIDECFRKGELLNYCEDIDDKNQLTEISKLARESIKREKALAKLEAEVIKRITEYDSNQITFDEWLHKDGDSNLGMR